MSPASAALSAVKYPLAGLAWSWRRQSWTVDGRFAQFGRRAGAEAWAGLRMVLAFAAAMSLEWHLAPLAVAGQAPVPIVAPLVACYVLTGSYGRMVAACVLAGLLRDAFSPSLPLGCSSLFFLLAAVVGRELCERSRRGAMADQILVGLLVPGLVGVLGHLVLVSSGVAGSAVPGEVVRRLLGGTFVAALVSMPLVRVAQILGGRALRAGTVLLALGTAWLAAWTLRHARLPEAAASRLPESALPSQS